jgi:predicted DNA-binding ribbon-helix-helix protein
MADEDIKLQNLIQNLADVFDLKKEDLGSEFRVTVLRHAAQALGALDEDEELEDDEVSLLLYNIMYRNS